MKCVVVYQLLDNEVIHKWKRLLDYNVEALTALGYDYYVTNSFEPQPELAKNLDCDRAFSWLNASIEDLKDYDYVILNDLDSFMLWNKEKLCSWLIEHDITALSINLDYEQLFISNELSTKFLIFNQDTFRHFIAGVKEELNEIIGVGFEIYKIKMRANHKANADLILDSSLIYAEAIRSQRIIGLKDIANLESKFGKVTRYAQHIPVIEDVFETNLKKCRYMYKEHSTFVIDGQFMWCHITKAQDYDNVAKHFLSRDKTVFKQSCNSCFRSLPAALKHRRTVT